MKRRALIILKTLCLVPVLVMAAPKTAALSGPTWEWIAGAAVAVVFWMIRNKLEDHRKEMSRFEERLRELSDDLRVLRTKITDEHINKEGIREMMTTSIALALSQQLSPLLQNFNELRAELRAEIRVRKEIGWERTEGGTHGSET